MKSTIFLMTVMAGLISFTAIAQDQPALRKKQFNLEGGSIAIDGYDPVAYFKSNKAIKGKKDLAVNFQGVFYYFSSVENKEEFKKNPSRYEPEYGGWCAYAMGEKGEKVSIDPETFKIVDNKLYLFYNRFFNNTLKSWNKDEARLKQSADASWKKYFINPFNVIVMTLNWAAIGIWALRILPALILLQTLFFKFSAADESVYIFSALGMEPWGRIGSGVLELIAALLLLYPRTTFIGAGLGAGLMAGAIFFHLTKLGISVQGDGGQLFIYALLAFISCVILLFIYREELMSIIKLIFKKNI